MHFVCTVTCHNRQHPNSPDMSCIVHRRRSPSPVLCVTSPPQRPAPHCQQSLSTERQATHSEEQMLFAAPTLSHFLWRDAAYMCCVESKIATAGQCGAKTTTRKHHDGSRVQNGPDAASLSSLPPLPACSAAMHLLQCLKSVSFPPDAAAWYRSPNFCGALLGTVRLLPRCPVTLVTAAAAGQGAHQRLCDGHL